MKILLVIVIVAVGIFLIRKAAVIGVAVFFGSILLILGVTVLRDQLHLPVNDYVDTTQIDNLRDKVVPVVIGPESDILDKKSNEEIQGDLEESEDYIDFDLLTEEEIEKIVKGIEDNKNAQESDNFEKELVKSNNIKREEAKDAEIAEDEEKHNKYEYSYKDLNDEKREEIYKEISLYIEDENFYKKLMGMSNYVDIEYDLGNGKMYNSKDRKNLIILIMDK